MIVLRFSNYEHADTVEAHDSIVASLGSTWWGWWKKRHEPWPGESSLEVLRNDGVVGLVERQSESFYRAECIAVAHREGQLMGSPEPNYTPEYYRDAQFPLWLQLKNIHPLTEAEWTSQFGAMPVGDETFFMSGQDAGVQVLAARSPANRTGLLHISDLHFGTDFGFTGTQTGLSGVQHLANCIAEALPSSPAAIVVSGDLTTRSEPAGFMSARVFLDLLCTKFGLDRKCVVIAPGNHDILIDDDAPRDFSNEQGFRDFADLFYGQTVDLERVHTVFSPGGADYAFGVVNSSRPRTKATMDYGYVGRDRSEPVIRTLSEVAARSGAQSFLVLHHHVQPAPHLESLGQNRPVSLTLDAGELVSMSAAYGLRGILHGHQHLPFVGSAARLAEYGPEGPTANPGSSGSVLTIGAGSLGASVGRLGNELRENSFFYYDLEPGNGLRVRMFVLNPSRTPAVEWDFIIK